MEGLKHGKSQYFNSRFYHSAYPFRKWDDIRNNQGVEKMKNDLMKVKKYSDLARVLTSLGYSERCNGGSHHVWSKPGVSSLSVPAHNSKASIAPGTLRNIVKLIEGR